MPNDIISKHKMLNLFKKKLNKNISIKPTIAKTKVNRTLTTIYPKIVKKIWLGSEFKKIPKLKDLISEM